LPPGANRRRFPFLITVTARETSDGATKRGIARAATNVNGWDDEGFSTQHAVVDDHFIERHSAVLKDRRPLQSC
jgi:hypothetical protein